MSKAQRGTRPARMVLATLVILAATGSAAQEGQGSTQAHGAAALHGAYGFSLSQSCVRTPFQAPPAAGFDPATKQLLVNGEFVSGFGSGVLRFGRDGVATLEEGLITEITSSQVASAQTPVSPGTRFECVGRHSVSAGNRVAVKLTCEAAAPPGLRVVIDPVEFEGFVGAGRTLNLNTVKRDLHTVTVYSGATALQQRQRVCLQSLTLNKL